MHRSLLTLSLVLGAAACTHHATMTIPGGFARLDGRYDVRAVNAEGVVIAARAEKNEPRADLGFWTAAVAGRLAGKGYTQTGSDEVTSRAGARGRLMRYDTHDGGVYWIALYAIGGSVVVAEATGAEDDVAASAAAVEAALLSARLD